jgi:hypothetical protein
MDDKSMRRLLPRCRNTHLGICVPGGSAGILGGEGGLRRTAGFDAANENQSDSRHAGKNGK